MSDGRAGNAAITEKIYYDDDIVKKFIYATIFWGAAAFVVGLLAALVCLPGCAGETLFRSNFDPAPVNQPPPEVQEVGTVQVAGPPGSVFVIPPPVEPSGKWVAVRRPTADSAIAGLQGRLAQFRGDGEYTFSAFLFIPSGTGTATVQFEVFNQPTSDLTTFLHLDFMADDRVRINDQSETTFGSFPRGQPFILQVTLKIAPASGTARIVLSGAGASGQADYTLPPPFLTQARQFGAFRVWLGFGATGIVDATNIVVKRKTG